jgi:hypothetical protein
MIPAPPPADAAAGQKNADAVAAAAAAVAAAKVMARSPAGAERRGAPGTPEPAGLDAPAAEGSSGALLDAGDDTAPIEEHVWWRIVPGKTAVVCVPGARVTPRRPTLTRRHEERCGQMEGMMTVTADTMTLSRLSVAADAPALAGPVAFPLGQVKECLLLPHLREVRRAALWPPCGGRLTDRPGDRAVPHQTFADAIKAHATLAPTEGRNYVYFRLRVRSCAAHCPLVSLMQPWPSARLALRAGSRLQGAHGPDIPLL